MPSPGAAQDVGLSAGPRRRVPGLRRDEVAVLSGTSTDYYIELERGQAQPSEQTLAALARALRLSSEERDYLFGIAGRGLPAASGPAAHVHPGMMDLLEQLGRTPARVVTDLGVTLAQNSMGRALLGEAGLAAGGRTSSIYRWFTEPQSRSIYPPEDHEHHSRLYVADLRAVSGTRGHDADVKQVIGGLLRYSPEFSELWELRDVSVRRGDRKRIVHPQLGVLELNCLSLYSEDQRQKLLWFSAPAGTAAGEQLQLLEAVGTQEFAGGR